MAGFHLQYRPIGGDYLLERRFEASDRASAYAEAARLITEAHGRPDAFVSWDRERGSVTVSAGYWSRRGSYSLDDDGGS